MSESIDTGADADDEIVVTLSDYLDGVLPANRRAEVEAKIAGDATWKAAHAEMLEARNALSGLQKARAPEQFTDHVTETISQRSAGRFFGRRTLGDRVPFGVLLIVALLVLGVLAYVWWSSPTGSLERRTDKATPRPPAAGSEIVDKP